MEYRFKPSDLKLSYTEFNQLCQEIREMLHPYDDEWRSEWEMWDLINSPMDDNERRLIRYGHYLGYMTAIRERNTNLDD